MNCHTLYWLLFKLAINEENANYFHLVTLYGWVCSHSPTMVYINFKVMHNISASTCSVGCPQVLRTDRGTENSILAMIQPMLRHNHTDLFAQHKSHIYGKSTSNQVSITVMLLTEPIHCKHFHNRKLKLGGVT